MSDSGDKPTVDPGLLRRFQDNPDHRKAIGGGLLDALVEVITTSDYNTTYPSSPLGRSMALDALKALQFRLEEAYNVVPGVDIPERKLHAID